MQASKTSHLTVLTLCDLMRLLWLFHSCHSRILLLELVKVHFEVLNIKKMMQITNSDLQLADLKPAEQLEEISEWCVSIRASLENDAYSSAQTESLKSVKGATKVHVNTDWRSFSDFYHLRSPLIAFTPHLPAPRMTHYSPSFIILDLLPHPRKSYGFNSVVTNCDPNQILFYQQTDLKDIMMRSINSI